MINTSTSAGGNLPVSVEHWIRALKGEIPWSDMQLHLAPTVTHSIAGRLTQGVDNILQMMQRFQGTLVGTTWTVLTNGEPLRIAIRGSAPGRSMPSMGGPLSAIDFEFLLDIKGRIVQISPHPHHLEPPDLLPTLSPGARIDSFELRLLDGASERFDPSETAALLVVFTCNHCPWALGWHARLQAVARDYQSHAVRMLQVNANDPTVSPFDSADRCRQRLARGDFSTPLFLDDGQRLARAWGARHTPEAFIFDRSGVLVYHGAPDADFQDSSQNALWLRQALDATLAALPFTRSSTKPVGCTIKWTL